MVGLDSNGAVAPAVTLFTACPDFHPVVNFSDIPLKVSRFDKLFHHKLQASTLVDLMPKIFMIITPQGFVSLGGIGLDLCRPFKLWKVANDEQQPFIRDV